MERPLAGRVALVAGATRGVGRGIAVELGAAGRHGRRPHPWLAALRNDARRLRRERGELARRDGPEPHFVMAATTRIFTTIEKLVELSSTVS